ncbi:MAG: FxsA family protein [Pirellulaceae bacterium]
MFFAIFLLIVLVPLADLVLLLIVNSYITFFPTLLLVIGTGVLGTWLARRQWAGLVASLQNRKEPVSLSTFLSDSAMILIAGALLITPGFITDLLGLSLLIPFCRRWYRARFAKWISKSLNIQVFTSTTFSATEEDVVEGKVHRPHSPHQGANDPDRIEASPF